MEVTGVVVRLVMSFHATGFDARVSNSSPCPSGLLFGHGSKRFSGEGLGNSRVKFQRPRRFAALSSSGFDDSGHKEYYVSAKKEKEKSCEVKKVKRNLKLIKRLSRDMSMFSDMSGNSVMSEVEGKMVSEAMEFLQALLQVMRTEQKELKRKKKAELKATMMKVKCKLDSSSNSSSESSDSECGEVISMTRLRNSASKQSKDNKSEQATLATSSSQLEEVSSEEVMGNGEPSLQTIGEECCTETASSSNSCAVRASSEQRVEVCMGGKCKKLGAMAILEEFEKKVGEEGAVVGCKCMGKCKNGPNVRLKNHPDGIQAAEREQGTFKVQTNPLYIGVTLEDVSEVVATFLGKGGEDK